MCNLNVCVQHFFFLLFNLKINSELINSLCKPVWFTALVESFSLRKNDPNISKCIYTETKIDL